MVMQTAGESGCNTSAVTRMHTIKLPVFYSWFQTQIFFFWSESIEAFQSCTLASYKICEQNIYYIQKPVMQIVKYEPTW